MSLAEQLREEGRIEGIERGRIEGIERGRMEGELHTQIEFAKRLLARGLELVFIAEVTGLSEIKIQELRAQS